MTPSRPQNIRRLQNALQIAALDGVVILNLSTCGQICFL